MDSLRVIRLTEAEVLAENLRALGASCLNGITDDAVFDAAVSYAREHGRIATAEEIAAVLGSSSTTIRKRFRSLQESGRMLIGRGRNGAASYVPRVV